jgi:antitoxin StbD
MLLERADQAISSTELQKNARVLLDRLSEGQQDRYVVIRDNRPTAVFLSTERYESLISELEDLRVEALARERLASLDPAKFISQEDMVARFQDDAI